MLGRIYTECRIVDLLVVLFLLGLREFLVSPSVAPLITDRLPLVALAAEKLQATREESNLDTNGGCGLAKSRVSSSERDADLRSRVSSSERDVDLRGKTVEKMDDSGAILCQISSFKDMLDQVNEEIEQNIQRTREIESEIVKCSEIEKDYLMKESDLTMMVSMGDFELNGLIQVAASARISLERMESESRVLKINLDDTIKRLSGKRDKFIDQCSHFQSDIVKGGNQELTLLLLEKEAFEDEKDNLNMKINALQNSTEEFIEDILDEMHSSSSAVEVEVKCRSAELRELLKDIDDLKILLRSISSSKNSYW